MRKLNVGDTVAIVGSSNALPFSQRQTLDRVEMILHDMGLQIQESKYLFSDASVFSGSAKERADALMDFYRDEKIKCIFDISGGDLANETFSYLDFDLIAQQEKTLFGYSDLTTMLNAIYAKTGRSSVLYQIRNLAAGERYIEESEKERDYRIGEVKTFLFGKNTDLLKLSYKMIQGNGMQGIVVGGNLRCFLKLAGTPYWPDMRDKILLLESLGGGVPQMVTYINQYKQMGVFDQISGILLGTFTQMEREASSPTIIEIVKQCVGKQLPIAKTQQIGHGKDSKAIIIGEEICL